MDSVEQLLLSLLTFLQTLLNWRGVFSGPFATVTLKVGHVVQVTNALMVIVHCLMEHFNSMSAELRIRQHQIDYLNQQRQNEDKVKAETKRLKAETKRLKTKNDRLQAENDRLQVENRGLTNELTEAHAGNKELQENCVHLASLIRLGQEQHSHTVQQNQGTSASTKMRSMMIEFKKLF